MQEIFADFFHPNFFQMLMKLGIALVCGLIIGYEREYRGKAAGIRTYMLICMGSCLFAIISDYVAYEAKAAGVINADPGRISAQVVTGIGFLGAGTIIQRRGGVSGLTSAAGIWGVAAIGLAAGSGMFTIALISAVGYVLTMEVFSLVVNRLRMNHYNYYKLEVVIKKEIKIHEIRKRLREIGLSLSEEKAEEILGETHYYAQLYFKTNLEEKIIESLSAIKGVRDVMLFPFYVD